MFCYQRSFGLPTEVITKEQFRALITAPETIRKVKEAREALARGDKNTYDSKKKGLPFVIFIATYDESDKEFENKLTGEKITKRGRWRNRKYCRLNGLCVIDFDHVDEGAAGLLPLIRGSQRGSEQADNEADNEAVQTTPPNGTPPNLGGERLREIWEEAFARLSDEDKARVLFVFITPSGHGLKVVFMADANVGNLIDNQKDFSAKLGLNPDESCKDGSRGAFLTTSDDNILIDEEKLFTYEDKSFGEKYNDEYRSGHSQPTISGRFLPRSRGSQRGSEQGNIEAVLASLDGSKRHSRAQTTPPDGTPPNLGGEKDTDIYGMLPLDKWAEELKEMAEFYPCMKELFLNVHPHKMPAVLFSSAALFGTLMTRAYYHFWYEPEIVRRLNYCIFIIGDPGAGKNVIEKFYFKIADPMIQADQGLIDVVNRYKDGRTERTTSTKAQKGDALKKPVVGIRVHPARTATGEFIRHMLAAVEIVQGQPMNLHMFSFDSELDNVTKNNKGGDWKDREVLELKAFHNEQDGQMYGNQESITGMFNVFWNFIYTGTPYALHRKVNQRNFGTGMSTRLAVIPLPDKGMAQRHQKRDPSANETLRTWAYRLDRVEGEIPIEPLNDETFDWQSSRLEIAEFNGDKADRTLLKRIPYYGIGVSLPFILMRHWDEWQEHKTLTMDDTDKRLCRLAMDIQYKCQQFFFGEMAFNYFADQNKEFVARRRTT